MPFKSPLLAEYAAQLQRPTGWEPAPGALDRIRTNADDAAADVGATVSKASALPATANPANSNARIAYSERDKSFLVNGTKLQLNGATLRALAEVDEADLPEMGADLPPGYVALSHDQVKSFFNRMRENMESSPGTLMWANAKSAAGGALVAIPRLLGADIQNPLGDSERNAYDAMNLREQVGADEGTFDSMTGFINDASRGVGSVLPAIAAGGGAGLALRGASLAARTAAQYGAAGYMGAGAAYDSQSEVAQARIAQALAQTPEESLMQQSPEYAALRAGGSSREEAIDSLAFGGGRAAGLTAAAWTLPETILGGKLVGNIARKIPGVRGLAGLADGANPTARAAFRIPGAAGFEGLQEYAEDPLSQGAANAYAGIDEDPMKYADTRSFTTGLATGLVFGVLGGHSNPQATLEADPLAAALQATQTAQERGEQGAPAPAPQAPEVDLDQREVQLRNLIAERAGPNWEQNIEQVAQMPQTRHLIGELIQLERDRRGAMDPSYMRRDLQVQPGVDPGQPSLQGPAFGDAQPGPIDAVVNAFQNNDVDTLQQMSEAGALNPGVLIPAAARLGVHPQLFAQRLEQMAAGMGPPNGPVSEDDGLRVAPNMRERREFSQMGIDQRRAASEQDPALLPGSRVAELEREIADLEQVLTQRWGPNWDRNPAMKQSSRGRSYADAYNDLVSEWEQAKLERGPDGVDPALRVAPLQQLGTPEPAAAPGARMPDGRPIGVSPDPLENPDPMSPEEAESRAQTQAERGGAAPVAVDLEPPQAAPASLVQGLIEKSKRSVSKTTAEPAKDVRAQVQAMLDPESEKDSVFIAEGDPQLAKWRNNANLPDEVRQIYRPGTGLLLTTSTVKGHLFGDRKARMTDERLAQILGYTESKAEVASSGEEPVVVRAIGKDGAVSSEQGATPSKVEAAKAAAARLGRAGDKVVVTTPDSMQARRSAASKPELGPKGREAKERALRAAQERVPTKAEAAARGRAREIASEGAKKAKGKKAAKDDERKPLDLSDRAATPTGKLTVSRGEPVALTGTLLRTSGSDEGPIKLRNQRIDEALLLEIGNALESGRLSGDARATAQKILRDAAQLRTMLEAAVAAKVETLKARHLEEGHKGKYQGDLYNEPLSRGELHEFAELVREQAQHELAQVQAGTWTHKGSVFRRAAGELMPDIAQNLSEPAIAKKLMEIIAKASTKDLQELTTRWGHRLQHATLAKEAVRGATEIAAAMETQRGSVPTMASDTKLSHITRSKDIPDAAANLLNGWVAMIERTAQVSLSNVRLMTISELRARYPEARSYVGAHGLHLPLVKYGKVREHVIAIDWQGDALSTEILAHEFGHVLTDAVLRGSPNEVQRAVKRAYEAWANANGGKTTYEILHSRLTGLRASMISERTTVPLDYALDFREWAADNIARFMLTSKEPRGVVEKFFADVAKLLRTVYEKLVGKNAPERAWQDAMDLWLERTRAGETVEPVDPWAGLDPDDRAFFEREVDNRGKGKIEEASELSYTERATAKLSDLKDAVGPLIDPKATKEARAAARGWLMSGSSGKTARKAMLALVSPHQMADIYAGTPAEQPLRRLVNLRDRISAYARELQKDSDHAHQLALSLSREGKRLLEQVMYKATYYGVHPDVGFDHERNAHLTVKGDARVTESNRRRHAEAAAVFEQLRQKEATGVEAYTLLRDALADIRRKTIEQKLENLSHFKGSQKVIARLREQLEAERDRKLEGPYFPLMRRGDYIVKATLPKESYGKDGKLIARDAEMFESKAAAEKEKSVMQQLYPGAEISVKQDGAEFYLEVRPSAVYFFNTERDAKAARAEIEADVRAEYEHAGIDFDEANEILKGNLIGHPFPKRDDFEQRKQHTDAAFWRELETVLTENNVSGHLRDAIEELYLESLPEFSYRKSMLTRERVLGASKAMLEAHAHRAGAASYALAEIRDSAAVSKAKADLDTVGRSGFPQAIDIKNAITKGELLAAERGKKATGNAIANAVTDANAFYSLALSPAYVVTNAMQPTMVTMPYLAGLQGAKGTVGLSAAGNALRDAYAQVGTYFTKKGWQNFRDELTRLAGGATKADAKDYATEILDRFAVTDGKPDPQLRAVLDSLLERGRLDFSFLNSMEDALRGGHSKWGTVMRLGMAFPQQVEAMNRVVSAIAAYRIAHTHLGAKDGTVHELPIEAFVDRVVLKTQLDYSTKNRPWLFNAPVLNVLLQFKLYLQGMYMLFVENGLRVMRGSAAERKQGAATIGYLLAMHGAVGGLAGVGPLSWLTSLGASALAMAFGDDDDKFKDGDTLVRQFLEDVVGEDLAEVGMRGAPTLLGLDIADRLGLPNLWDSKYANISERDTPGQGFDKAFLYALGSPYANARRVYTAVRDPADKGLDGLPAGMRAAARAARYGLQGVVDHDGDQFIAREKLNWAEIGASAIGFQPAEISRAYRERNEERGTKGRIELEREEILKAARTGDLEGRDLQEKVQAFNRSVPPPFRITAKTIADSREGKRERDSGATDKHTAAVRALLK